MTAQSCRKFRHSLLSVDGGMVIIETTGKFLGANGGVDMRREPR